MAIGAPMLSLRGQYLALATVGLNVTIGIVAKNWTGLTGGGGVPGVPLGSWNISSNLRYYYLALGFLTVATLCGVYGALSGTPYAHFAGYISPGDFDGVRAITLLVMLIVGGETSIPGAIAGCILIRFAPEWLRVVGEAYLTVFGLGIIAVLVLLPGGLTGMISSLWSRYAPLRA